MAALGMAAVDSMLEPGSPAQAEVEIDEQDPRLLSCRERLRDRLKSLLAWARQTGRL
jgi:hypothetical protein